MVYDEPLGRSVVTLDIGRKLKQERVDRGLSIDDISRATRIAPRYLEAIETGDHSSLPGLVFIRGWVRQYALALGLDPDPLLSELPKPDETKAALPVPPANPRRSSYRRAQRIRALILSTAWLAGLAAVGALAYVGLSHYSIRLVITPQGQAVVRAASPVPQQPVVNAQPAPPSLVETRAAKPVDDSATEGAFSDAARQPSSSGAPVQVTLTASARAWIRLTVDGKTAFVGTLTPNETKEISASEQVNLLTGNAGALTISLNGKTLDSLGRTGQTRELRLTAEGPEFLSKDPRPELQRDQL